MNFKEFLKDCGVQEIGFPSDQKYEHIENAISQIVWICDFRLNKDRDAKPIRNVPPKLVMVVSNNELPKGKNVYYSPVHFREVKKSGYSSTVIAPYDNTGYRSYTGVSLNIFYDKEECYKHFKEQCDQAILEYKEELERRTAEIMGKITEIEELKGKY